MAWPDDISKIFQIENIEKQPWQGWLIYFKYSRWKILKRYHGRVG